MRLKLILVFLSVLLLSLPWMGDFHGFLSFFALVPLLTLEKQFDGENNSGFRVFLFAYLVFGLWNGFSFWWGYKASFAGPIFAIFVNASFYAIVFWMFHLMRKRYGNSLGYSSLIVFWLAFEYMHHRWDLANPWLSFGNAFAKNIEWVQFYEYTGVLGGSLWVLAMNIVTFHAIQRWINYRNWRVTIPNMLLFLILLIIPLSISKSMYKTAIPESNSTVSVSVIQPNIDPYHEKYDRGNAEAHINGLIQQIAQNQSDYYIAPETFMPYVFWEHNVEKNKHIELFKQTMQMKHNASLILGASTKKQVEGVDTLAPETRYLKSFKVYYQYMNAALLVSPLQETQFHHKSELVLGVERIPFPGIFAFANDLIMNFGGVVSMLGIDKKPTVFENKENHTKIAAVVCWESVFGETVGKLVAQNAEFIALITNDGWWDNTQGHKQHMYLAKLRAIETRKYVVRSANTGISAIINERGETEQSLGWWKKGVLTQDIRLNKEKTFYVIYGDIIGRIASFFTVILVLFALINSRVKKGIIQKH